MKAIKILILVILSYLTSYLLSFGFWYFIFWFITNEQDGFMWMWLVKLVYIVLSLISFVSISQSVFQAVRESIFIRNDNE